MRFLRSFATLPAERRILKALAVAVLLSIVLTLAAPTLLYANKVDDCNDALWACLYNIVWCPTVWWVCHGVIF